MSLTYNDISALVDAGNSAAEIATALGQDTRHVRDCWATKSGATASDPDFLYMLTARYDFLDELKATIEGLDSGSNSDDDTDQQKTNALIKRGWKRLEKNLAVTDRRVLANSDDTGQTGALISIISSMLGSIVETATDGATTAAEVVADVYTLTGGPRFAGVDAAAVQAVIDLQAKKAAIDTAIAAEQSLASPHNVAVSRLQSLKNQDTYALTLAEIEAEIATVRTYPETYPAGGE